MPYTNLRVKNVTNSNPAHIDQIGVERNGATILLPNGANRDLAASDIIQTEATASLKIAAEDANNPATSDDAVQINGADVTVLDGDLISIVDEYYDGGVLVRDLDPTDQNLDDFVIRG